MKKLNDKWFKEIDSLDEVETNDEDELRENYIIDNGVEPDNEVVSMMSTLVPEKPEHYHIMSHCLRRLVMFTESSDLILIHDDPSDTAREIHRQLLEQQEDRYIRIIYHKDVQGISPAWNTGFKFVDDHRYVFVMSADFCLRTRKGDKVLKKYMDEDEDIGWIGISQANQPPDFSSYASILRLKALQDVNYLSTFQEKCDFDDQDLALKLVSNDWKVFSTDKVSCYHLARPFQGICDKIHDKNPEMFRRNREKFVERWGEENLNFISRVGKVEEYI